MKTIRHLVIAALLLLAFSRCEKDSASGLMTSGGAGGSTARFTISGNYLYVVDNTSLKTYRISDPLHPEFVSRTDVGINIETIFPYQDKLFIGSSFSMYIYSLASPEHPVQVAKADYQIRMACDPVVAKDSVAYATLRATGPCGGSESNLVTYNIKNLSSPALANATPLQTPWGLGMKDNALYVCKGTNGLAVFNITDRFHPIAVTTVGPTGETFYDVIPYGNVLIAQVANGVILYDISNPLTPVFISKIS